MVLIAIINRILVPLFLVLPDPPPSRFSGAGPMSRADLQRSRTKPAGGDTCTISGGERHRGGTPQSFLSSPAPVGVHPSSWTESGVDEKLSAWTVGGGEEGSRGGKREGEGDGGGVEDVTAIMNGTASRQKQKALMKDLQVLSPPPLHSNTHTTHHVNAQGKSPGP